MDFPFEEYVSANIEFKGDLMRNLVWLLINGKVVVGLRPERVMKLSGIAGAVAQQTYLQRIVLEEMMAATEREQQKLVERGGDILRELEKGE